MALRFRVLLGVYGNQNWHSKPSYVLKVAIKGGLHQSCLILSITIGGAHGEVVWVEGGTSSIHVVFQPLVKRPAIHVSLSMVFDTLALVRLKVIQRSSIAKARVRLVHVQRVQVVEVFLRNMPDRL
ncbi:hypothetical protein DGG96_14565 [Legionella qingyii]|uniref:Uncharacterized protein n=1 Tax=Legionella qingyii TaxID=2184757 RepID=A0A317TZ01_9GAMM|nr:hypothetical protein DGG96_14565 [Legionella qingyii]